MDGWHPLSFADQFGSFCGQVVRNTGGAVIIISDLVARAAVVFEPGKVFSSEGKLRVLGQPGQGLMVGGGHRNLECGQTAVAANE